MRTSIVELQTSDFQKVMVSALRTNEGTEAERIFFAQGKRKDQFLFCTDDGRI